MEVIGHAIKRIERNPGKGHIHAAKPDAESRRPSAGSGGTQRMGFIQERTLLKQASTQKVKTLYSGEAII
jgi:hypothetical protein